METRILCVGNELVCDDGVGVRVGRVLLELPLPPEVAVWLAPPVGLDLLDLVRFRGRLVLVDATRTGKQPGTVSLFAASEMEEWAQAPACCHLLGIPELLRLAHELEPMTTPDSVVLVGIEAEDLEHFGIELTAPVRAAIPAAVKEVLAILGADAELLRRGSEAAARAQTWVPSVLEAHGG